MHTSLDVLGPRRVHDRAPVRGHLPSRPLIVFRPGRLRARQICAVGLLFRGCCTLLRRDYCNHHFILALPGSILATSSLPIMPYFAS